MKNLCFLLLISLTILSCSKDDTKNNSNEPVSYLDQWIGIYEGTSHLWSTYPSGSPSGPLITNNDYKNVSVNVQESRLDSSLNFIITYNETIVDTLKDLNFSSSGIHFSQWGGGSSYGSLNISFDSDTLHYYNFQKCGIPCNSGIDFSIKKK